MHGERTQTLPNAVPVSLVIYESHFDFSLQLLFALCYYAYSRPGKRGYFQGEDDQFPKWSRGTHHVKVAAKLQRVDKRAHSEKFCLCELSLSSSS